MKTLGVSNSFNMSNYSHGDTVNNAIRKYENQLWVKKICETVTITSTFHFSGVGKTDVKNVTGNLNSSRVRIFKNIPTKCLKVFPLASVWISRYTLVIICVAAQRSMLKRWLGAHKFKIS